MTPEEVLARMEVNWLTFKQHSPAGAYLPVGQLDGDCRECGAEWPCPTIEEIIRPPETCGCYTCQSEVISYSGMPMTMFYMIVCPDCGNKRCPKATHHDNECTASNDPMQPGSRYGGV